MKRSRVVDACELLQTAAFINLISRNGIERKEGGYDSSILLAFVRQLVSPGRGGREILTKTLRRKS